MCIRPRDSRFFDSRRTSALASPPGSTPGPRDCYLMSTTLPHQGFLFRNFIRSKHHIHGILDTLMNQTPRDGFPCRDFPNHSDLLHASLQMDDLDPCRDSTIFDVLVPSTSGMSISRFFDSCQIFDTYPSEQMARIISGFPPGTSPSSYPWKC